MSRERSSVRVTRRGATRAALALGLGAVVGLTGCDPRQAMYFLQPFEPKIPAPCPSLKEKRVVVLANAASISSAEAIGIEQTFAKGVAEAIRENVKKVDVVDVGEVNAWALATPTWTDPTEAARAFDADVVIFLEVREFQIQDPSSPGLFEGRANTHIQVTELVHPKNDRGKPDLDAPAEPKVIYEGDRVTNFPVTGHIPIETGVNASTFRNRFVEIATKELSWHFIDHAPGDNIQNTRFGE